MKKKDVTPYPALFPNPVSLVTCGPLEHPNIITIAWAATACREPPMVSIAVTPSRHSYNLILESGDFVVNIPFARDVFKVDLCGNLSGETVDKFAQCGYTPEPSLRVTSPRIEECPVSIECYLEQTVHLGTHDLFIGHVANVAIDESLLLNGKPDLSRMDTLAYAQGTYYLLGEAVGTHGFSVKEKEEEPL